jgi:hypothetical protein
MHIKDGKELWDTLDVKFGAADAGSKLYIMESFHDFKMTKDLLVVQQAYETQCIAKELELLKCALPDKFVASCIIAKLSPSWRNFDIALKHKRQEISVENLIESLMLRRRLGLRTLLRKERVMLLLTFCRKVNPQARTKGTSSPPLTSL